ncbi:TPA: glycosyltransferase family 2 protein [Streptococcus suis]
MNNKFLTISIAAYNVAEYIEQALDSLVKSKYIDNLEIFVVDDGGTDSTLEIANRYQKDFPNSVFCVHKENGGYGSTVNTSLNLATGKYFKLLDGDDWFETQSLDQLIEELKLIDTDVVITNYKTGPSEFDGKLADFSYIGLNKEQELEKIDFSKPIGMWAITYRTQLLKDVQLRLPERMFYTDQYYCTIPFSKAKTIKFLPISVYFYRIGRDGQSVSRESRIKNIDQTLKICEDLIVFSNLYKDNKYIQNRVTYYYLFAIRSILLLPITKINLMKLKEYEDKIKKLSPDIFLFVEDKGKFGKIIRMLRYSNYFLYWSIKLIPGGLPNW